MYDLTPLACQMVYISGSPKEYNTEYFEAAECQVINYILFNDRDVYSKIITPKHLINLNTKNREDEVCLIRHLSYIAAAADIIVLFRGWTKSDWTLKPLLAYLETHNCKTQNIYCLTKTPFCGYYDLSCFTRKRLTKKEWDRYKKELLKHDDVEGCDKIEGFILGKEIFE